MQNINKVLYNHDQSSEFTTEEKATARNNIGAQAQLSAGSGISISESNEISCTVSPGPTYTFGDGLTASGTDISVTRPVPAPDYDDVGKFLTVGYNRLSWSRPRQTQWGSSIGGHKITATDIANGYCDIPIYFWQMSDHVTLSGLTWFLLIEDAGYVRGSTSSHLVGYADTVKVSWCDDEHTWESYDNAHGSDPQGQLFEDIDVATELTRIPGYPTLVHPIRRIGGDPASGTAVRGPSFRVTLQANAAQVDDTVSLRGKINVIRFEI